VSKRYGKVRRMVANRPGESPEEDDQAPSTPQVLGLPCLPGYVAVQ
jgi:hypothetical protein